jgi:rubrerythrin
MSDLIKREDAIDALYLAIRAESKKDCYTSMLLAEEMGNNILSVEPERKKGTWKPDESGNVYWICSVCGFASEASGANILYHYCPNCGADMRGGHE